MKDYFSKLTLEQKRGIWGFVFLSPWLLGFMLFFAGPIYETFMFSLSSVNVDINYIETTFIGLDNYRWAFTIDPFFNQFIITLAFPAMATVAIVVIFSLFAAILINGKYPGKGIVRTIFFVPIIMGASIAGTSIVGGDAVTEATTVSMGFGGMSALFLIDILQAAGVPAQLTAFLVQSISEIFQVLAQSGVPILIFLAGLQAIPAPLYEVAKIEGSTAYECFWKVTLPMISPMILLSTVYTIVDLFSRHSITGIGGNQLEFLARIRTIGFTNGNYGLASAMVMVYILACILVISLVTFIMSKKVFYYD